MRQIFGLNPLHFWGWDCSNCSCSGGSKCSKQWYGYYYQKNRISRREVANALGDAVKKLRNQMRYPVGREWFEETLIVSDQRPDHCYRVPAIQLCNNHLVTLGVKEYNPLGVGNVTYTDSNGNDPFLSGTLPLYFEVKTTVSTLSELEYIQAHFTKEQRPLQCPPPITIVG